MAKQQGTCEIEEECFAPPSRPRPAGATFLTGISFSNSPSPGLSNGVGLMPVYALWKKLLGHQGRGLVTDFQFSSFLQGF